MAYSIETEKLKAETKKAIRNFFDNHNYIEVDTPLLSKTTIPEHTIELFQTVRKGEFTPEEDLYLLPSPELFMKKLICKYKQSIYQISKAFRNAEQKSPVHNSEFTMLEYYSVGLSCDDSIKLTKDFIKDVFKKCPNKNLLREPATISISDMLKKTLSISLSDLHDRNSQNMIEKKFGLGLPQKETFDDTFNRVFVHIVEPALKNYKEPVFLTGYPVEIKCLAAESGDKRERFEMYVDGIEIANGYGEMTDKKQIATLFDEENRLITECGRKQKIDSELPQMEMPITSGVAIGLDRLIMSAWKIKDIKDVIGFVE